MTDNIKELYENKLRYNASYYETTERGTRSKYLIVFLGTNEFLIISNYYGCCACGVRSYDWDANMAKYTYTETKTEIKTSTIEKLINEYERKKLQTRATITIERED